MAGLRRFSSSSAELSVIYSGIRGVDMSSHSGKISRTRLAYMENMYRDYEGVSSGAIESIPGFRVINHDYNDKVNGIYSLKSKEGRGFIIAHVGGKILRLTQVSQGTATSEVIGSAADSESQSIPCGTGLLILDGEELSYVTDSGTCAKISDDSTIHGYVPTTHINGIRHEQRNLLTRRFKEITVIGAPDKMAYGSDGLVYEIISDEEKTVRITAYVGKEENLFIPSVTQIGDAFYSVKEISAEAFKGNSVIKSVKIAEGVSRIGKMAFSGCSSLLSVITPDSTTELGNACFGTCGKLSTVHIGRSVVRLGLSLITQCPSLSLFTYSGTKDEFSQIENTSVISGKTIEYEVANRGIKIKIPIHDPAVSLSSLKINSGTKYFECHISSSGLVDYVTADFDDKNLLGGAQITIEGILSSNPSHYQSSGGFLGSEFVTDDESPEKIIRGCTVAEAFDGRIFLSGNPKYPNAVFYSTRTSKDESGSLYFGDYNYFCDGIGSYRVVSLLSAASCLIVFKEGDDGTGSIFYHTPSETGIDLIPKIYPTNYIHSGVCTKARSISFFDDPVFVCDGGLCALEKEKSNLTRSISCRSDMVNSRLLSENLSKLKLAVWQGYLAVCAEDRIYLADSRATFSGKSGELEYEWFFLSGIGAYSSDRAVYRYSSIPSEDLSSHPTLADEVCEGVVTSAVYPGAVIKYYTTGDDGTRYEVYPTEERTGGTFHKLSSILGVGNLLYFGTEDGHICIFNNDLRGTATECEKSSPDFDEAEYKRCFGRTIHPSFYSFAGHPARYAISTPYDDCDIPHLVKNTTKGSLTVKFKTYSRGEITLEVGTDSESYRQVCKIPAASLSFSDLDFGGLSLAAADTVTIATSEKEKGWVEKQISLYSEEINAPLGIYSIAYRFKIKGKIKNNR